MQSHNEIVSKIIAACQKGEDPVQIIMSEREHLENCEICQAIFTNLLADIFERDESYSSVWMTTSQTTTYHGYPQDLRELVDSSILHVKLAGDTAMFLNIPDSMITSTIQADQSNLIFDMNDQSSIAQKVSLPADDNKQICLSFKSESADKVHLAVEFQAFGKPVDGVQVYLSGTHGDEFSFIQNGKAIFRGVESGQYDIEMKMIEEDHSEKIWKFALKID